MKKIIEKFLCWIGVHDFDHNKVDNFLGSTTIDYKTCKKCGHFTYTLYINK